ncbi:hypothetical protein [Acetobacterium tundrae]|uniref:Uncharacterized protein n=1 Tax=Acetobacterium tundrae TaxID=132932 RepID=A0ABR6WP06_9FIRM|nr:hypothetical protein [Acetobacterium tundrae]MBC3798233.1 hypothetical protein [Acetobacterium tundrae]
MALKKYLFPLTLLIMIIALGLMSINWFILPFPDWTVRIIGTIMLFDITVLVYSLNRYRRNRQ